MVSVNVRVAELDNELMRLSTAQMGNDMGEERVGRYVEWNSET